jgi:hypothetical protein
MTQPSERQEELNRLLKQTYDRGFSDGVAHQKAKDDAQPETWQERRRYLFEQVRVWLLCIAAAAVCFFLGFFLGTPHKQTIAEAVTNASGIAALVLACIVAANMLRGKK